MHSFHHQLVSPTGVSHSVCLDLYSDTHGSAVKQLVTARANFLQVFDIVPTGSATYRLKHVISRTLHGYVTGMSSVRILASKTDGLDRLLVAYKEAKMSLLEWDDSAHDLIPISLHTFEKLPQLSEGESLFATDPESRLAALLLPTSVPGSGMLGVLPFFQDDIDLDALGPEADMWRETGLESLPYAPSYTIPLSSLEASLQSTRSSSNTPIRFVSDMVFLPGFNEPTLAILYASKETWVGHLESVDHNFLVSLVALANDETQLVTKSGQEETPAAVVISTSPALPFSCLYMKACPQPLGGVLVVTSNGILHLEQGGKMVCVASNSWFWSDLPPSFSSLAARDKALPTLGEALEGSSIVFILPHRALVFLKSGAVADLIIHVTGRNVSRLTLTLADSFVPVSCAESLPVLIPDTKVNGTVREATSGFFFAGSHVAESTVVKWDLDFTQIEGTETKADASADVDDEMDVDLYGDAEHAEDDASATAIGRVQLAICDQLDHYGAVRDLVSGAINDDGLHDIVATSGTGPTAGITVFHKNVPFEQSKMLLQDQISREAFIKTHRIHSTALAGRLYHFVSGSDATEVFIGEVASASQSAPLNQLPGKTLFATSTSHDRILRVTPTEITLLDSSLSPIVSVSAERELVGCTYLDEYALLAYADHSWTLHHTTESAFSALPVPPEFRDVSAACVTLLDAGGVCVLSEAGTLSVFDASTTRIVFKSTAATLFPWTIIDKTDKEIPSKVDHEDLKVEKIFGFVAGQQDLRPHLGIILDSGSLFVYEKVHTREPAKTDVMEADVDASSAQHFKFVKVLSEKLFSAVSRRADPAAPPPAERTFVPFTRAYGYTGLFITGETPVWLAASDHGPIRYMTHAERGVYAFSAVPVDTLSANVASASVPTDGIIPAFFTLLEYGYRAFAFPPNICFERELAYTRAPLDRHYQGLTFDADAGMYVCSRLYDTRFTQFDDEGVATFKQERPDMLAPTTKRSTIELVVPGTWQVTDGFEFRQYEFVSSIKTVTLTSQSTRAGVKDFIAVGTAVHRAEDLATRGGIYLFEIVRILSERPEDRAETFRLRLVFMEDTKSIVGALGSIDGYLLMSMGQKLYVRALEQDEVLLACGFLDVGVHVISIQTLKNLIIVGDLVDGISFVAFQEDPYKLEVLGKENRRKLSTQGTGGMTPQTGAFMNGHFLVNEDRVSFLSVDSGGVARVLEYEPRNILSQNGQKLMLKTEYHLHTSVLTSLVFARPAGATSETKQNGVLYGCQDGSLLCITPAGRDIVYRRLLNLQTQMNKYIPHFGGLNPKAFRIVQNDSIPRPIPQGMLIGPLLQHFTMLPLDVQADLGATTHSEPYTLVSNIRNLLVW